MTGVTGATGHDDNYGIAFTARGNATTIQRLISGTAYSTTHNCYDTLGNVTQTVDANGNPTTYDYTENWVDTNCIPAGTLTHAFPTTVTDALGHRTKKSYFTCTSLIQSTKDENDIQAGRNGTTYTYEQFNRPVTINHPDGGQTTYCYSHDSNLPCYTIMLPPFSTASRVISGTTTLNTKTLTDSYGRVIETQLTSDPDCASGDKTDTTYDNFGRVLTASNPYCTTGDSTYGLTTYAYDALGRTTQVIPPDGSAASNNVSTAYSGNTTTVTDQAGKSRKSVTDALGRLTQVFEDPAGSNYETDYTYDTLDNLLTVNQKGGSTNSANWRPRTFTYDFLSRLLTASNPESGAISYSYDANGNLTSKTSPAPNQTGSATVTTSYCYDALNRLTSKAYTAQSCPMSSPAASYFYDQSSFNGLTITNGIGRRTGMTDQAGNGFEAWSYDSIGRVLADKRTVFNGTTSVAKTIPYTYNLDGSVSTISVPTWPDGSHPFITSYLMGGAGRPLSIANNGFNLEDNAHYTPSGALCYLLGHWGESYFTSSTFNSRLQPSTTGVEMNGSPAPAVCSVMPTNISGAINLLNLTYSYGDASSHNNGNVASITNNFHPNRSQTFTYDSLNRLATAQTTSTYSTDATDCWAETYTYDPWGNLITLGANTSTQSAYIGCTQESGFNFTGGIAANNRVNVSGYTYDSAGNIIAAPPTGTTFTYDAENHLISTAGVNYTYDGDGKRIMKSSGTIYWYGMNPDPLLESDLNNNALYGYFFFNGKRVVRISSANEVNHFFTDALGSTRAMFDWEGGYYNDSDFYPFGAERVVRANNPSHYKFTAKERDSESGLDYFGARFDSSSLGRFMSPDEPFADQQTGAPQSWNLYAYARNNPINYTDEDGRTCTKDSNGNFTGDTCDLGTGTGDTPDKVKVTAQSDNSALGDLKAFSLNAGIGLLNTPGNYFAMLTGLRATPEIPAGQGTSAALGAFIGPFLFPEVEIEKVVEGAAAIGKGGQMSRGAQSIAKKLGRALREGYKSAFHGSPVTTEKAAALVRDIMSNPARVGNLGKYTEIYNAAGQGVRLEKGTNNFVTFVEGSKAKP